MSNLKTFPKLLGVSQAAEIIDRPVQSVYKMCERGELPHLRIVGQIRFTEELLAEFLQSCVRPVKTAA